MTNPIRRFIAPLSADQRGVSIVELAVVAPVLAMLVVGVGDLARGFSEKYALQQAANRTLEMAQLGSSEENYDFLIAEAADAADVDEDDVDLDQWLECNGSTAKKDWEDTCAAGEEVARYVTITINSTFDPVFGSVGYPGALANGTVPISASASLRVQ